MLRAKRETFPPKRGLLYFARSERPLDSFGGLKCAECCGVRTPRDPSPGSKLHPFLSIPSQMIRDKLAHSYGHRRVWRELHHDWYRQRHRLAQTQHSTAQTTQRKRWTLMFVFHLFVVATVKRTQTQSTKTSQLRFR